MTLLIVVLTSGCVTGTADECAWARPILPSAADVLTRGTKEQIVAHNEAGAALCGWRP